MSNNQPPAAQATVELPTEPEPPDVAEAADRLGRIAAHENPYKVYFPDKFNGKWTDGDEREFQRKVKDDHSRLAWAYVRARRPAQPTRERELDDFDGTPDSINRLPKKLFGYIHDLETNCDPSGNIREIAALKENQASLTAKLAEAERERNEAVAGNLETMRRQVREWMTSEADRFKDKSVADLLDWLTTAITSLPTAFHPLMAAINQALADAEQRAEAVESEFLGLRNGNEAMGDMVFERTKECNDLAAKLAEAESALSTLRDQEAKLLEAMENGERFYQLELREDDGWVALSDRVHEGAGNFKSTADWFDEAKVYHTYQDMRLVQVTKLVLHERTSLATAEPPAQVAE